MSNAVVTRIGQALGTGSDRALFLVKFGGEVLTTFNVKTKFLDKNTVKTIDSGKSASFPCVGQGDAEYHVPGTELLGTTVLHNERVITIDDKLVAHRFLADIDEAMNHFDARSIHVQDIALALQRAYDTNVARIGVLAARAAAIITGGNGGTRISDTDCDTSGTSLAGSIFTAAQKFDEKNVPEEGRFCFVRPAQYRLLAQTTGVLNRDWGGSGSYADGTVLRIAGIPIISTNQLPSTNVVTGPVKYQGDFSDTVALVMNTQAVGTLKLMSLAVESERQISRQGELLVASYAMGHGILRAECAAEISKGNF